MHVFLKSDRFDFVTLSELAPGEHNTAVNESCPFITLPSSAAAPAHLGVTVFLYISKGVFSPRTIDKCLTNTREGLLGE